jgi:hypothetical protein
MNCRLPTPFAICLAPMRISAAALFGRISRTNGQVWLVEAAVETQLSGLIKSSLHAHRQTPHGRRPQSPRPRSTSDKCIDQFAFFSGRSGVGYCACDKTSPSRGSRGYPSRALAAQSQQCVGICARSRVPYVWEFLSLLYCVGPLCAALSASPDPTKSRAVIGAKNALPRYWPLGKLATALIRRYNFRLGATLRCGCC